MPVPGRLGGQPQVGSLPYLENIPSSLLKREVCEYQVETIRSMGEGEGGRRIVLSNPSELSVPNLYQRLCKKARSDLTSRRH